MFGDSAFDRILVTDSLVSATGAAGTAPSGRIEIVPVAPLVAEAIRRLHDGGSIAELLGSED